MRKQTRYKRGSMTPAQQYAHDLGVFENYYDLKVVEKSDSWLMKALFCLSFMWIWNPAFMRNSTTTIGTTIYTRPLGSPRSLEDLATLRHEAQHVEDSLGLGQLAWALLYLFPQSLSILAVSALWLGPIGLLPLVTLGPWPAPFRVWAEMRGFARTYWTWKEFGVPFRDDVWEEWVRDAFCGWGYYRMAWRWRTIRERMWTLIRSEEPTGDSF